MAQILDYLHDGLEPNYRKRVEIILVPSHTEITHVYPLPQPAFEKSIFENTKFARSGLDKVHLVSNPGLFTLNDISVAFVNNDLMQGMCRNVVDRSHKTE